MIDICGKIERRNAVPVLAGILALLPFSCPVVPAYGQALPLDDKARYEKALEQKVDEILLRILGPNQAKVSIDVQMDFTRTEKLEVEQTPSQGKNALFRWQSAGREETAGPHLMPGYPVSSPLNPSAAESLSYQKQMIYPSAFVKKLTVTLILSRNVGDVEAENVRVVVADLLGISLPRGDELLVLRAPFAPAWKTIWYTPETISLVFKYGVLTLMGILAMLVVSIGFLKLAGAMNSMAKAQQTHQLNMGLDGAAAGAMDGLPNAPEEKPALAAPRQSGDGEEPPEGKEVVFNVKPGQIPFLVNLMVREDPGNVSIVTAHLAPEIRSAFLKALPPDISAEVIANLSRVRFLEPDVILTLKDELERRLNGAVGGVDKVMEALERVNLRAKKELLQRLEKNHPEIAASVRERVLLPEDLVYIQDKAVPLLVSAMGTEDLAAAAWEMPDQLKEKFRSQMAERAWEMVLQTMKYGSPSPEKTDAALEKLVVETEKLVKDGVIVSPLQNKPKMIAADGVENPGAAPVEAKEPGPAAGGPAGAEESAAPADRLRSSAGGESSSGAGED
ncbi:MAG: FliG C-terminal domain-containing protein [Elusimicrobiota bacterium]